MAESSIRGSYRLVGTPDAVEQLRKQTALFQHLANWLLWYREDDLAEIVRTAPDAEYAAAHAADWLEQKDGIRSGEQPPTLPPVEPPSDSHVCDWVVSCTSPGVAWRWAPIFREWAPVCDDHKPQPEDL